MDAPLIHSASSHAETMLSLAPTDEVGAARVQANNLAYVGAPVLVRDPTPRVEDISSSSR